jgi:hypothetical protein
MGFRPGDRVIATDEYNWIKKGTKGVIVEARGVFSNPEVAFENGKRMQYPENKLAKI